MLVIAIVVIVLVFSNGSNTGNVASNNNQQEVQKTQPTAHKCPVANHISIPIKQNEPRSDIESRCLQKIISVDRNTYAYCEFQAYDALNNPELSNQGYIQLAVCGCYINYTCYD